MSIPTEQQPGLYAELRERVATKQVIDLDRYPELGWLIEHLMAADKQRSGENGIGWIVQHGPILGGPHLQIGVRGTVGAAVWADEEPGSREIPALGAGEMWEDYFSPQGDLMSMPPGSQLSFSSLWLLVRVFARSRQRPDHVRWLPEPVMRAELLPPRPAWLQLRHTDVLISPHDRAEELIDGLEQWNAIDNGHPDRGFTWTFTHCPCDLYWHGPMLDVGVRGDMGALMWLPDSSEIESYRDARQLPASGSNHDHVDYFAQGHHFVMPPGSEVPLPLAYDALREFVHTGQRPTCIEWA